VEALTVNFVVRRGSFIYVICIYSSKTVLNGLVQYGGSKFVFGTYPVQVLAGALKFSRFSPFPPGHCGDSTLEAPRHEGVLGVEM
jgi:hypothetical protein